ncbi:hypothetical protein EYZ11_003792 [Aspergillus tanneri]|uniref:Uncharacterized protein n=1 Tax=Aspergillus tanneri TaxID=1220188 RepID=A0A4V3UPW3_9EURO|nr:uncharacterized protein ATNIH1004_001686 [Aspergillus tanneri]KAA8652781.1 hypothetical protein ATNIH1004_001686 [Aspergillus tanneri]THC96734.1 hypothetical protein EYZ11_003792 [Aspergillus tanneri]
MLLSMCISLVFVIIDTCAIAGAFHTKLPVGIEPFWKLSFIFKCLCDTVILDDFKQALDRIRKHWIQMHLQQDETSLWNLRDTNVDGPPVPQNNLPEGASGIHVTYGFTVSEPHVESLRPHSQV